MVDALLDRLRAVMRHCSRLEARAGEALEIECRVRLQAHEFYALVELMAKCADVKFVGATVQRDAIHGGVPKRRTCCDDVDGEPLFGVEKRAMLAQRFDIALGAFEVHLDAQRELYTDVDECRAVVFWRQKKRRSFAHARAPLWRIDMTRVLSYNAGQGEEYAQPQYEMEFELVCAPPTLAQVEPAAQQLRFLLNFTIRP